MKVNFDFSGHHKYFRITGISEDDYDELKKALGADITINSTGKKNEYFFFRLDPETYMTDKNKITRQLFHSFTDNFIEEFIEMQDENNSLSSMIKSSDDRYMMLQNKAIRLRTELEAEQSKSQGLIKKNTELGNQIKAGKEEIRSLKNDLKILNTKVKKSEKSAILFKSKGEKIMICQKS